MHSHKPHATSQPSLFSHTALYLQKSVNCFVRPRYGFTLSPFYNYVASARRTYSRVL